MLSLCVGTAVEVEIPACRFSKRTKLCPTVDEEEEVNRAREKACLNSGTKDNEGTSESDYEVNF